MMIRNLLFRNREVLLYLFFGGATTLVNIITYFILYDIYGFANVPSSTVAQVLAILFAYVTNKLWVFNSKSWKLETIGLEIVSFFGCRIASAVFDVLFMWITVDILSWWPLWMKIVANVIVVVLNYVASKFLIFKKK